MLMLFNTLSGKKEKFKSIETGKVKMYTCGPTVYGYAHIGNLAAYIFADTLRRLLEHKGYEVRQIVNITDVGHLTADDVNQADTGQDKMLKAALREKKSPEEIAIFYTECFFEDIKELNIKKAQYYPRATAHIPQMIKIIETLIEKGLAYEKNGNVFFDVEKFDGYGKLSKKKLDELKIGARLEEHPDKKHPHDFSLWLRAPKEHLLKWDSPWSKGYPGWHIECSAMSMEYLGETLDIHTGGEDHIFPHHENEIAQSEGATGKQFAHFWFHNRFLLVDNLKMSKSKGNFFTLRDVLEKNYDPMSFRLLILSSHYRSNATFTWEALNQAKTNYQKIIRFVEALESFAGDDLEEKSTYVGTYEKKFEEAMDNDLNTPLALSVLFELISSVNKKIADDDFNNGDAHNVLKLWHRMNEVFGIRIKKSVTISAPTLNTKFTVNQPTVSTNITKLLEERELARKNKDYTKADQIRKKLEKLGFTVEDTSSGQKARKNN